MKREKIRNVKPSMKLAGLIGTVILVDSLIVGTFALGGHLPVRQDDKKINMIVETVTTEKDNKQEIEVSNYYDNEMDTRNRVVYYKMPYYNEDGVRLRDIETVYRDNSLVPKKHVKTVLLSSDEPDESYIETYEYDINTDHFIRVKETLHDELLSDFALLMVLGTIDMGFISVGKSLIKRKEEDENKA